MTSEAHASLNVGNITDVALHEEITCRAYELYEQLHAIDGYDSKDMLRAELPRVIYAAAQLEVYVHGLVEDSRAVRAARVYLRALSSIIGKRNGN